MLQWILESTYKRGQANLVQGMVCLLMNFGNGHGHIPSKTIPLVQLRSFLIKILSQKGIFLH